METICGMKTMYETRTIAEMETIICVVTGKNTSSLSVQGIGTAIGTTIVTTGGMVIDAASLMDRG